jgi:hypothetical protein
MVGVCCPLVSALTRLDKYSFISLMVMPLPFS